MALLLDRRQVAAAQTLAEEAAEHQKKAGAEGKSAATEPPRLLQANESVHQVSELVEVRADDASRISSQSPELASQLEPPNDGDLPGGQSGLRHQRSQAFQCLRASLPQLQRP